MSLPYPILKLLWDSGYAGKVIRVPAMSEKGLLRARADELLREVEDIYERSGTTFVLEKKGRSHFFRSFGLLVLCRRFHVAMEDARKLRRRAYWRWFRWMESVECMRLKAADRFSANGDGRETYLKVRRSLRKGKEDNLDVPNGFLDIAKESIRSVKWR